MTWWTAILVALIAAGPPSFLAWLAWKQGRKSHVIINHRMDELVKLTRKDALAEGNLEGRAAEKKRASRK
jgi:hypothetical protein